MDRTTAKTITWAIILLMLLLMGVAALIGSKTMLYLTVIFGTVLIIAIQIPFQLCPHCGHFLGRQHLNYTHCPYCGEQLCD